MPEQGERETVSIEAHQRVTQERDNLKTENAELRGVATSVTRLDAAYSHFKGKEVGDPYGLAKAAVQNTGVLEAEGDDFPVRLDSWFDERTAMFGTPAHAAAESPPSGEVPEETPAVPAPRPSAAGPNPAAPGEPVTVGGRLKPGDTEYKEVLQREGIGGIRRLEKEGRVERHPDNPYRVTRKR